MELAEDILVFDNGSAEFYRNDFTNSLTKWARNPDTFDVVLPGWTVYLVKFKEGGGEYVLLNDENIVVSSNTTFEGLAVQIDMAKIVKQFK